MKLLGWIALFLVCSYVVIRVGWSLARPWLMRKGHVWTMDGLTLYQRNQINRRVGTSRWIVEDGRVWHVIFTPGGGARQERTNIRVGDGTFWEEDQ
jgi:hypothetical protein